MARKRKTKYSEEEENGYASHSWMLQKLAEAQEADHDNREISREAAVFVNERGGQWEQMWWERNDGKPRYTFDLVTPILDQINKTMDKADYDIKALPADGAATKEIAETFEGLIRNIENISDAKEVYGRAGRSMTIKGLDGWRVVQKYIDGNSFDQDLVIEKVPNWIDSVWFGPHTEQDASDAKYCFVLAGLTPDEFKRQYPERSESAGLSSDRTTNTYYNRQDLVMVGEFIYLEEKERELVLMSTGQVYEVDDEYMAMQDELARLEVTEVRRRKRKKHCVYIRKFDLDGWIGEPQETEFENWLPVVPLYGNFDYDQNKVIYFGAVEKLIDPQRVFNYSLSREIEEGALAPRAKYWMTPMQAAGFEKSIATLNTNSDPVQFFNPDPELPGAPQQNGGAQVNPGLARISEAMQQIVGVSAGLFAANMGDNPGLQSGKAIEALQDRGDAGTNKYVLAREVAQRQTGRILVNAIPRVYLPSRQVRILSQDGTFDMMTIGQEVQDSQTGQVMVLNDLSQGRYDVTCVSGPSFNNRQSHTVTALTEIGQISPEVIAGSTDILTSNINAPGMDKIAERERRRLFMAGLIPPTQLTDAERAELQQQQQQGPQPDPMTIAAMAEQQKAQAQMLDAETKQIEAISSAQESEQTAELKRQELQIKAFEAETERYRVDILKAEAISKIQGNEAKAEKDLAQANATSINNAVSVAGALNGSPA